jgi:hypothetical protein
MIGCGGAGDRASIQRGSGDVSADISTLAPTDANTDADINADADADGGVLIDEMPIVADAPLCDDTDGDNICDADADGGVLIDEMPIVADAPLCDDTDGDNICDDVDLCFGDNTLGDPDRDGLCGETAACSGTPADEAVSMYLFRRPLTINHQQVGMDNTGNLPASGFPVLVTLQGDWLHTSTTDPQNGKTASEFGYDIVFTASDGITLLAHDLEEYNAASGTLTAWVRIDSLSKATDTTLYMYYGNPCLTSPTENQAAVWDSGYKGVWHLNEDPGAAGVEGIKDATANNHNGTPFGGLSNADSVTGIAGKSIVFSQQDCYINFGDVDDFDFGLGNFAVSGWIKGNQVWTALTTKSNDLGPYNGLYIYTSKIHNNWTWWGSDVNDDEYAQFDPSSMDGNWHHLAVVREGTGANQFKIYTDGVLTRTTLEDTNLSNDKDFMIHRWHDEYAIAGTLIDEVRVSNTARSYDWIRTSYNNQSNPGAIGSPGFYTVGAEESLN